MNEMNLPPSNNNLERVFDNYVKANIESDSRDLVRLTVNNPGLKISFGKISGIHYYVKMQINNDKESKLKKELMWLETPNYIHNLIYNIGDNGSLDRLIEIAPKNKNLAIPDPIITKYEPEVAGRFINGLTHHSNLIEEVPEIFGLSESDRQDILSIHSQLQLHKHSNESK